MFSVAKSRIVKLSSTFYLRLNGSNIWKKSEHLGSSKEVDGRLDSASKETVFNSSYPENMDE